MFLNGYEIDAPIDEQERIILQLAAGDLDRREFTGWLRTRIVERTSA